MLKQNIVLENLSYAIGNRTLFSNISLSFGTEKTGLVGANGTGKTTLLKILVGELMSQEGAVHVNGIIGYMPQSFVINQNQTIAEVFGIDQKIMALSNINAGHGLKKDFEIIGEDWLVVERAEDILHRCKLDGIDLSRRINSLSGGQTTRVFFARLLMQQPDLLIIDEPTNNLDSESRLALYDVIQQFNGGLLIVSHDRQLLTLMDQIVEISSLGVKTYGGNYTDYDAQKQVEQEALGQDIIDAQKQLRKTQKTVQLSKERYDQRVKAGNKLRRSGSELTAFLDKQKNRAENTKSKLEQKTDKQLEAVKEKLTEAKARLEQKDLLAFELEATRVHNTKIVLDIKNLTFAYPEQTPILADFSMTVIGPKRIAIAGKNGSGKTTLLKLIMGQLMPTSGSITIGVQHYAYLDQALSVLDMHQTVLENFQRLNPDVLVTDCRLRLAIFLFAHDDALKLTSNLSGGEKMRAALACVLMGNTPPQLILLDEPTNNMDLSSIASIEQALQNYKGALLVVSHDALFLENIGVEKEIALS